MKTKAKKSKKKLIITLSIIAAVLAGLFVGCRMLVNKAQETMKAMTDFRTGEVTNRSLISSVAATGKVIAVQTEDLTVPLSGIEIEALSVEVGDRVTEGQELVRLDTGDIADSLAMAQHALSQTQGQFAISQSNAQRQVEDAQRNRDFSVDQANDAVNSAKRAFEDAVDAVYDAQDAEDEAWEAWRKVCRQIKNLEDTEDPEELQQLAVLKQSEPQLEAAYKQMEKARKAAESNADTLYDRYLQSQKAYDNTVLGQESAVQAAQAGQQTTALSVNTDQQTNQIKKLKEQLEDGILAAPFDGIVTAVNYDEGDTYLQGAILTVQDCSSYEISAQIGEYDISDIAVGQKVLIKTDATRDEELEGTVRFISPTATPGQSVTYEIKITVDSPSDRLRLDMSASLSIIIAEHASALTVPYNAVQTAEDGSTFVEVAEGEGYKTVPVTVLMESNYYTEVEGDLTEGQQVKLIDEEADNIFASMMNTHSAAAEGGTF